MEVRIVTADYFKTMGIPVVQGRPFEPTDTASSGQVVVLNESAVRRFFPGQDPLGQRITVGMGRPPERPKAGGEVVGIVGDVKDRGLAEENPPEIYLPNTQIPVYSMDVVLRTAVSPLTLARAAEAAVHEIDPELPVARMQTLQQVVARSLSEPRFYMLLLAVFAGTALLLAALGIFGVMSYAVAQRSREIGIRVALGAPRGDLLRMVLGQAVVLAVTGVAVGFVGAVALSRTMASLLFNLSSTDPLTLSGVGAILTAVALLASYLPARQAAGVDPVVALRGE
jgi:putative ABC transport system permease protein